MSNQKYEIEKCSRICVASGHSCSIYSSFFECHGTHERYARTLLMHKSIAQFKPNMEHEHCAHTLSRLDSFNPHITLVCNGLLFVILLSSIFRRM